MEEMLEIELAMLEAQQQAQFEINEDLALQEQQSYIDRRNLEEDYEYEMEEDIYERTLREMRETKGLWEEEQGDE